MWQKCLVWLNLLSLRAIHWCHGTITRITAWENDAGSPPAYSLLVYFPALQRRPVDQGLSFGRTHLLDLHLVRRQVAQSYRCSWRAFAAWLPLMSCFELSRPRSGFGCVSVHRAFRSSHATPGEHRKATRIVIRPQVYPVQHNVSTSSDANFSYARQGRRLDWILVRPLCPSVPNRSRLGCHQSA